MIGWIRAIGMVGWRTGGHLAEWICVGRWREDAVDKSVDGVWHRSDCEPDCAVGESVAIEHAAHGWDECFESEASVSIVVLQIGEGGLLRCESLWVYNECECVAGVHDYESLRLVVDRRMVACDMLQQSARDCY